MLSWWSVVEVVCSPAIAASEFEVAVKRKVACVESWATPFSSQHPAAMKVTIKPRSAKPSKRFPVTLELASSAATVGELKALLASKAKVRAPTAPSGPQHALTPTRFSSVCTVSESQPRTRRSSMTRRRRSRALGSPTATRSRSRTSDRKSVSRGRAWGLVVFLADSTVCDLSVEDRGASRALVETAWADADVAPSTCSS